MLLNKLICFGHNIIRRQKYVILHCAVQWQERKHLHVTLGALPMIIWTRTCVGERRRGMERGEGSRPATKEQIV